MKTFGQIAYEGYCAASGGKSLISGAPLPAWDALSTAIQCAWDAAGIAVLNHLEQQQTKLPSQIPPAQAGEGVNDGDVRIWPRHSPHVTHHTLP